MFDVDMINIKAAMKVNLLRGARDLVGSSESMCKGELLLADICTNHVGEVVDAWYPCGPDDWSNDDGPVRALLPDIAAEGAGMRVSTDLCCTRSCPL